jgi:hypothetical protein
MLDTIKVKELGWTNLSRTPLPSMISKLNLALIALVDLIPLLVCPVLMLVCPRKTDDLIYGRDWRLSSSHSPAVTLLFKSYADSLLSTALS